MANLKVFAVLVLACGLMACREEAANRQGWLDDRLFESIRLGDMELADSCLQAGARLEARNAEGATPLIAAASSGRRNIAALLLNRGADAQCRREGYYGSTALMEAATSNDTAVARLLLEHGADVNRRDTFGDPALNWAAYYGHIGFTRLLLAWGASWEVASRHGTAIDIAIKQWNLPLAEFFIQQGAGQALGSKASQGLIEAVRSKDLGDARYWLQNGAAPGQKDELGTPVLIWASARGDYEMVNLLLNHGADPDAFNRVGQTALAAAARFGHPNILRLLLEFGAGPDEAGENYQLTPLISAAMGGHADCGRLLLQAGASPDIPDAIDGYTPLMFAATYNHPEMVRLLIEYEANPYIKSKDGTGIYELISFSANPEIARMIEAYVLNRQ
ncbi:MAG: ankyrin repeat domain-containing protein [Lewinellaceae bacterium]|nr:ankyrin repeat domain-containing protein [Lewinellaceae bacterium]